MMTRMFGFCCCCCADAVAGATSAKASDASRASRLFQLLLMVDLPMEGSRSDSSAGGRPVGRPPCSCRRSVRLAFRGLDLLHHLVEVVARRVLHRRELLVGLKLLQPQRLADWQHVPIVDVGSGRRADRATHTKECLVL